jgi:hypothetical protein
MAVTLCRGGTALWERHSMFLLSSLLRSLHHAVQTSGPLDVSYTKWFLVYRHSVPGKNLYLINCSWVNFINIYKIKGFSEHFPVFWRTLMLPKWNTVNQRSVWFVYKKLKSNIQLHLPEPHDKVIHCVQNLSVNVYMCDWICGLVFRVLGYRSRGLGFDSRRYQIFWEAWGLERGPLSLISTIEELRGRKSSEFGLENREYDRRDLLRWQVAFALSVYFARELRPWSLFFKLF